MKLVKSMKHWLFRFTSFDYKRLDAMISRKGGQSVVGLILRMTPAMQGGLTSFLVMGIKITMQRISRILRHQGKPGLVKYLKACSVALQQSICGHVEPTFTPRVSRTGTGLPRLLPVSFRNQIRRQRTFYMRLSLTLCSLYRDLLYASPVKTETITKPFTGDMRVVRLVVSFVPQFVKLFVARYAVGDRRTLLSGKMSLFPIRKASPQSVRPKPGSNLVDWISTSPLVLMRSAQVMPKSMISDLEILARLSSGPDYEKVILTPSGIAHSKSIPPVIHKIRSIRTTLSTAGGWLWGPNTDQQKPIFRHSHLGKLGLKQEAAGKMRVFAMVDPWTQWVMAPIHKGLFSILRKHPKVDGTFDQLRPLTRAWAYKALYSMDLSSATDRLPMMIQVPLLQEVFHLTLEEAEAWKRLLVDREYLVPKGSTTVKYAVGQPMGALSSWAMLAMTHHLIIQVAAWTSGKPTTSLFKAYAVLGDDVVIFDSAVAKRYHRLIIGLGVECNLAKSILSHKGIGLEFAKKTFALGENISPTPLKEFHSAMSGPLSLLEYGRKYNLSIAQMLKVAGFGYRVLGRSAAPFQKLTNFKVKFLVISASIMDAKLLGDLFQDKSYRIALDLFKRTTTDWVTQYLEDTRLRWYHDSKYIEQVKAKGHELFAPPLKRLAYNLYWDVMQPYTIRLSEAISAGMEELNSILPGWYPYQSPDDALSRVVRLISIEKKVSTLSIDAYKLVREDPVVKGGTPKSFILLQSWNRYFSRLQRDLKTSETTLIQSNLLGVLTRLPVRSVIKRTWPPSSWPLFLKRFLVRRLYWTGSFFALLSVLSYVKGVGNVMAGLVLVWASVQALLSWADVPGTDNWWFTLMGNVILHTAELWIAAALLVAGVHHNLFYDLWVLDLETVRDGQMTVFQMAADLFLFLNRLMVDEACGVVTVVSGAGQEWINQSPLWLGFITGGLMAGLVTAFIRWFLGF